MQVVAKCVCVNDITSIQYARAMRAMVGNVWRRFEFDIDDAGTPCPLRELTVHYVVVVVIVFPGKVLKRLMRSDEM